jgi:hypothetical protein
MISNDRQTDEFETYEAPVTEQNCPMFSSSFLSTIELGYVRKGMLVVPSDPAWTLPNAELQSKLSHVTRVTVFFFLLNPTLKRVFNELELGDFAGKITEFP